MRPAAIDRRYRSTALVSRERLQLLPLTIAGSYNLNIKFGVIRLRGATARHADRHYTTNLCTVAADCLDRATFHRLFAQGFFLR
jgi:hypothetical protein